MAITAQQVNDLRKKTGIGMMECKKALVEANEGLQILGTDYAIEDYAIAVKKGNTTLLDDINKALEKLTEDGTVDKIVAKYIKAE